MVAGVSKGAAFVRVAERLGIALSEVVAVGDCVNDLEMLSLPGKGILMENADPRLADALAYLERLGSHRDEAVARWLARNILGPAPSLGSQPTSRAG